MTQASISSQSQKTVRPADIKAGAQSGLTRLASMGAWSHEFFRTPGRVLELVRYCGASAVSLTFDTSVFLATVHFGLAIPAIAGAIGYACGMLLNYFLSVNFIFDASRTGKSSRRLVAEYVASGVLGIILTSVLIGVLTSALLVPPLIAKLFTVGVVFITIYLVRSAKVFAPRSTG